MKKCLIAMTLVLMLPGLCACAAGTAQEAPEAHTDVIETAEETESPVPEAPAAQRPSPDFDSDDPRSEWGWEDFVSYMRDYVSEFDEPLFQADNVTVPFPMTLGELKEAMEAEACSLDAALHTDSWDRFDALAGMLPSERDPEKIYTGALLRTPYGTMFYVTLCGAPGTPDDDLSVTAVCSCGKSTYLPGGAYYGMPFDEADALCERDDCRKPGHHSWALSADGTYRVNRYCVAGGVTAELYVDPDNGIVFGFALTDLPTAAPERETETEIEIETETEA